MNIKNVEVDLQDAFTFFTVAAILFGIPSTFPARIFNLLGYVLGWIVIAWVVAQFRQTKRNDENG
jgi:hypothetical protein